MRDEYRAEAEALASSLRATAEAITNRQYGKAPLRDLQRRAHAVASSSGDAYLRTLGFVIDQWIQDYYYNFAGDVMSSAWEEVEKIRIALLREVTSQGLMPLASALSTGMKADGFSAIEVLISSYLTAIEKANTTVEKAVEKACGQLMLHGK